MSELDAHRRRRCPTAGLVNAIEFARCHAGARRRGRCSPASTSRSATASSSACSGRTASGKTTLMRADPRPAAAAQRRDPRAGQPVGARQSRRSATCRRCAARWINCASAGWDFVASGVDGHRWGLPLLGARRRARGGLGARRVQAPASLRGARWRETSGGERQRLLLAQALLGAPAAAAARRAADQPRPAPSARRWSS